jgi:hypothetical protein
MAMLERGVLIEVFTVPALSDNPGVETVGSVQVCR